MTMTKTTQKANTVENLALREAELIALYPTRGIVPGSLMPSTWESNPQPGKQTLEITCIDCGATRRIATQDLFQVERCEACTKAKQRRDKNAKRAANPEIQAKKVKAAEVAFGHKLAWGTKVAAQLDREIERTDKKAKTAAENAEKLRERAAKLAAKAEALVTA